MIGEFGVGGPGTTDVKALVSHAKSMGWPVLGWAWNGDDTALKMNMVAPSWQRNVYTPGKIAGNSDPEAGSPEIVS